MSFKFYELFLFFFENLYFLHNVTTEQKIKRKMKKKKNNKENNNDKVTRKAKGTGINNMNIFFFINRYILTLFLFNFILEFRYFKFFC